MFFVDHSYANTSVNINEDAHMSIVHLPLSYYYYCNYYDVLTRHTHTHTHTHTNQVNSFHIILT